MSALAVFQSAVRSLLKGKATPPVLNSVNDRGWFRVLESYAGAWQENVEVSLDGVLRHPTVFACIWLIASSIAKLNFRLVEEIEPGVWQPFNSPSFSPVLTQPNPYQTRIQFYITWLVSKLIHGNTYVLKQRDDRGVVVAEYVLDPNRIEAKVTPDGAVWYEIKRDNLSRVQVDVMAIPASEIIHDVYLPLYHPLVGVSPIHAIGVTATSSLHIQSNSANFYANSANPGGLLTAPGEIPREDAAQLKADWEANYSGSNTGRVAVMGWGLTYQPLKSMNATDAQVIEQLQWTDEKICGAYGVPGFMIEVGDFPPYNSVVQVSQNFNDRLQIHIESIELLQDRALNLIGRKVDGRQLGTEFDISGLVRMDPAAQITAEGEAVVKSLKTIDEARRVLNLPKVDGGDVIRAQEQYHSIKALSERDENDPFAKPEAPPQAAPTVEETTEEPDPVDTKSLEQLLAVKSQELAERFSRAA